MPNHESGVSQNHQDETAPDGAEPVEVEAELQAVASEIYQAFSANMFSIPKKQEISLGIANSLDALIKKRIEEAFPDRPVNGSIDTV